MHVLSSARALLSTRVARKTVDCTAEEHAANPLSSPIRALRADGAGTCVVRFAGDSADRTFTCAAGEVIHGLITHYRATSTATGVVGFV